ncbi:MAG: multidrug effflux MFS transporter [Puniceicoccales bacterium]|jgi:DHA1 family bicyclomycin/chloramphenicol resistance-like MFS transporter|nr:multidrug effflux MFS transporter [Puniceicoccales bacterium]
MTKYKNTQKESGEEVSARQHLTLAWVLGSLSAFGPLATDMYLPAFPKMRLEFATEPGRVQLTLAVFLLGLAFGQLLWGTWSDRTGRRLPLLVGFGLFVVTSACCALATSVEWLILARFLMGIGGSAGQVVSRAIARDLFEAREAARFYSLMMIVSGIAPIVGPFLGNLVLAYGGWRLIFGLLAGLGVACWLLVWRAVPETLLLEEAASSHLSALFRGYSNVLRNKYFLSLTLALGCMFGVLFSYISSSPFVFKLYGVAEEYFGILFAVNGIGLYLGGQSNARLLRRFSETRLLRCGAFVNLVAMLLLILCVCLGQGSLVVFFVLLFISLSSLSFIFPNATALAMRPFALEAGSASATLGIFQFFVGALGGALAGVWGSETALPVVIQIALFAFAGNFLILFLTRKSPVHVA